MSEESKQPEEAGRADYNKTYYDKNKESILERKRSRYHEDAEYRERCKQQAKERRRKNKDAQDSGPAQVEIGEIKAFAHPVKALAQRINRSVSTINHWQRTKTMPFTPFYSGGGHRLYTDDMVLIVVQALSVIPHPKTGSQEFYNAVKAGWESIGVELAED